MEHIKKFKEFTGVVNEGFNKDRAFYCIEPNETDVELRLSEDEDGFLGIGYDNAERMLKELQGVFRDFEVELADRSGIYVIRDTKNNTIVDSETGYDIVKEIIENTYPNWTEYFYEG